jgi:GDP-L-fucose synthase|tara:strand:+ start:2444 stop:3337 length:894 start_codon:yes stop_codon:yes gene_type:complete
METIIMKNKSALVIGASGMVGTALMKVLGSSKTYFKIKGVDIETDMTIKSNTEIIKDYDHIYHLAGKKGSPQTAKERPADYLPMLQFDTNIIEAVGKYKPEWFLYTSSIGVYPPMEVYEEDKVWHKVPSENDKIPGYIKRMGELSCYAIRATHGYENISIVRPANIYGPNDNFGKNSMVIPALIKKGCEDDMINVWGDGSPIRDFIYCEDVAKGMLHMVENKVNHTVNLGSGEGVKISDIANTIGKHFDKEVKYDKSKPNGDMKRLMSMKRANDFGFTPKTSLNDGIQKTIEWYLNG